MMTIEQSFKFGKYKGLTIREVFQGTNFINIDLLKNYIFEIITKTDSEISSDYFFLDVLDFEISETLIRAKPCTENYSGNFAKNIENLFSDANSSASRFVGILNLDEFNIKNYSLNKEKPVLACGNPDYIEWCIRNVDFFYMNPEELSSLQELDVYLFIGISVEHKIEDIYEYKPKIKVIKHLFNEEIININKAKFDTEIERDHHSQQNDFANEKSYGKYSGSYAQDVEHWSDQEIDDAFGGDADAYWNID